VQLLLSKPPEPRFETSVVTRPSEGRMATPKGEVSPDLVFPSV
jgi:hypothetical protein